LGLGAASTAFAAPWIGVEQGRQQAEQRRTPRPADAMAARSRGALRESGRHAAKLRARPREVKPSLTRVACMP
jgi:hypothetical protein